MPYHFIFPIGDWSGDGHAFVAEYMVKSDGTLKDVRETHFANAWLGEICSEYNDNKLGVFFFENSFGKAGVQFAFELAKKHGLNILFNDDEYCDEDFTFDLLTMKLKFKDEALEKSHHSTLKTEQDNYEDFLNDLCLEMNHDALIEFWIFALNFYNSSLNLEIVSPAMSKYYIKYKGLPFPSDGEINFYGYDENKRHLNTPGYGVWSGDEESEFYLDCN
jgi:hypothetical protein